MAMLLETSGLDPLVSSGSGTAGATEMAAIYDTEMRWNPASGTYEPHTAESHEPNEDHTVWTLALKPGITFTDGTPYDAEAVAFGLNRTRAGQPGAPPCEELRACPRNTRAARGYMIHVSDIEVLDELTLQITLARPWPGSPLVLADEPGMVPSPTALREMCSADPDAEPRNCDVNPQPVGAGPFMIDELRPGEAISMARNPSYWGGEVALDGLRFISLGDAGGSQTYYI